MPPPAIMNKNRPSSLNWRNTGSRSVERQMIWDFSPGALPRRLTQFRQRTIPDADSNHAVQRELLTRRTTCGRPNVARIDGSCFRRAISRCVSRISAAD